MSDGGSGASPEWLEQGLRDALLRDGQRIISALYNDRSLLPDEEKPLPFEVIHRNRRIHTLFGRIELRRNYHHHVKSGTGRCPLDDLLGLNGSYAPAVARLMCRAASRAGSYREASEDLAARTREAKLGCIFAQTIRDEDVAPIRDPESTSYVSTYKGCREIAVLLHQEARRRGLDRTAQVVFIGDGAAWVWGNCRLTFPKAVEILDFYHASEHVGQLAAAIHDDDPAEAASCRARWCHDMKQSSPAGLLAESRVLLETHPDWSTAKREAIQAEINYLESHAMRTRYGEYRAKGWFIGSGVIESGCKTVIGRRLKQSGMFWSETGAEDILGLRCLVLGPHFDAAWKERRHLLAKQQAKARRWSPELERCAA